MYSALRTPNFLLAYAYELLEGAFTMRTALARSSENQTGIEDRDTLTQGRLNRPQLTSYLGRYDD